MTDTHSSLDTTPPAKTRIPVAIEEALAAGVMAAICLITFANVVVRYFTDYSFAFTEEYSIVLMVVLTLIGSAAAVVRNHHIRITFLIDKLTAPGRKAADLFALVASMIMFALLVWLGGRLAWDEYRFEVTSPGLGDPQWLYTIWMPLLSAVILLRLLGATVRRWRGE